MSDRRQLEKYYQGGEYLARRAEIIAEVQCPRVNIDRACWTKTEAEKDQLKAAKSLWKKRTIISL